MYVRILLLFESGYGNVSSIAKTEIKLVCFIFGKRTCYAKADSGIYYHSIIYHLRQTCTKHVTLTINCSNKPLKLIS